MAMKDDRAFKQLALGLLCLVLIIVGVGFAIKNAPETAKKWADNWRWVTKPIANDLDKFDGRRVLRDLDGRIRYCDVDYRLRCLVTPRMREACAKTNRLSPLVIPDDVCGNFLAVPADFDETRFPNFASWQRPWSIVESGARFVAGMRYAVFGAFARAPVSALVLFVPTFLLAFWYLMRAQSVTWWTFVWVSVAAVGISAGAAMVVVWINQLLDPYIDRVMLAIAYPVLIIGAYGIARKRTVAIGKYWYRVRSGPQPNKSTQ